MIWNREPRITAYKHVDGSMEVDTFRYTPGKGGLKLAEALKKGRIIGEDCGDYIQVPPRGFCRDLSKPREYIELPEDTLWYVDTFTIVEENGEPQIIILARPEGERLTGGLIHRLKPGLPVYIGMPVKPVFKPPEERKGTIEDILYFDEYA